MRKADKHGAGHDQNCKTHGRAAATFGGSRRNGRGAFVVLWQSVGRSRRGKGHSGLCAAVLSGPEPGYQALVQDPLQQDGYFTVSVKDGQILSDSYETDVGEKGNTIRRMEQTYTQLVQKRLEELEWPAPINPVVRLDKSSTELVQLGMEFSQKGALVYHLMLEGTQFPPTLDGAVQLLGQVYAQMETAEYAFASYGVQLEKDGAAITVAQVLPSQIKGGNLARILQLALEGDSENGVYISIQTPPVDSEEESTSADQ